MPPKIDKAKQTGVTTRKRSASTGAVGASQKKKAGISTQAGDKGKKKPAASSVDTSLETTGNTQVKDMLSANAALQKQVLDLQKLIKDRLPGKEVNTPNPPVPAVKGKRGRPAATVSIAPAEVSDDTQDGTLGDNGGISVQDSDMDNVDNVDDSGDTGDGVGAQEGSVQQQLNELRNMVSSLSQQHGKESLDMSEGMHINAESVSKRIKGAIGGEEMDTGEAESYTKYMVLGSMVEAKVKAKIWAHEYVDLASLHPKSETRAQPGTPSMMGMPSAPPAPKQPANWSDWYRLFSVYAAVYLKKYPECGPDLLSYMFKLHNMARKDPTCFKWRAYDVQFRQLRQNCTDLPWYPLNPFLLADTEDETVQNKNNFRQPGGPARKNQRSNGNQVKLGLCYDFNDSKKVCHRQNCRFAHRCDKCLGAHPGHACPSSGRSTAKPSTPNTFASGSKMGRK